MSFQVIQGSSTTLSCFDIDGHCIWEKANEVIRPERLAVGKDDVIYVTDFGSEHLRSFQPYDNKQRPLNIPTIELKKPQAICASKGIDIVVVSHLNQNGVKLVSMIGKDWRKPIMFKSVEVICLALFEDKYLAMGTQHNTVLYDVAELVKSCSQ